MKTTLSISQRRLLWCVLIFIVLIRLLSLGSYPLADTTEARYAEIARLMAESGDWITPQIHQGVPFWGKPPLSTWLSSLSIKVLGLNEFAVRLPSWLMSIAVLALIYTFAADQRGRDFALLATVTCASTVLIFVSSGAVMTDPALLLGTTLSMVAFWRALSTNLRTSLFWGYLLFVGLAIGLLAKGPVAVVLTGLPIGGWIIWKRDWGEIWHRIPWLTGLALCLTLSGPWYWLAEIKTPGFLDYFIIGEHWKRFLISGWSGDLYGNAHSRPLGTIWIYWLVSVLPWSGILFFEVVRKTGRKKLRSTLRRTDDGWNLYLAFWSMAPMVFFTAAGNILWTYVLPGVPAFAVFMVEFLSAEQIVDNEPTIPMPPRYQTLLKVPIVTSICFALAWVLIAGQIVPPRKCQKDLAKAYHEDSRKGTGELIYLFKRPHSAEFYTQGRAKIIKDMNKLNFYLQNERKDYFAIREKNMMNLSEKILNQTDQYGNYNGYILLKEKTDYISSNT